MLNPNPSKSTPEVAQAAVRTEAEVSLRGLFEGLESNLLRYAFSLTGRREVAEEIVQEVFLQLHTHWKDVQSPRAWLFRSVRNRAFHYLRQSKREILHSDDQPGGSPAGSSDRDPEEAMMQLETAETVRGLLAALPAADRELVALKYFEGLKYREISERTGLTITNVGYRLHKIMHQLAGALEPLGIDKVS